MFDQQKNQGGTRGIELKILPYVPRTYTLSWNCSVSMARNSFFILPPFILPFRLFLMDFAATVEYSRLPYNWLINQYNIFTERDSGERYCQYRETLSKARRRRKKRREQCRFSGSLFFLFFFPPSPSLVCNKRERSSTDK